MPAKLHRVFYANRKHPEEPDVPLVIAADSLDSQGQVHIQVLVHDHFWSPNELLNFERWIRRLRLEVETQVAEPIADT